MESTKKLNSKKKAIAFSTDLYSIVLDSIWNDPILHVAYVEKLAVIMPHLSA